MYCHLRQSQQKRWAYHKVVTCVPLRIIFDAIGHPQPQTNIKTDNYSIKAGFVKDKTQDKR